MPDTVIRFAIVGYGRAGQARAKAIRRDPRSELAAVHGGRRAAESGAWVAGSVREAIDGAHVVCVCSPPALRADHVREALEHGRHVICEYPLAATEAEAEALYALAARNERTLHVAFVDLLGAAASTLRSAVHDFSLRRIVLSAQAPGEETTGEELARRSSGELLRVIDLAGPFQQIDEVRTSPGRAVAWLTTHAGVPVELTLEQSPYFGPWRFMEVNGLQGTWTLENQSLARDRVAQTLLEATTPCEKDHAIALRRMLHGEPTYLPAPMVLHALRVSEFIAARRTGAIPPA